MTFEAMQASKFTVITSHTYSKGIIEMLHDLQVNQIRRNSFFGDNCQQYIFRFSKILCVFIILSQQKSKY